MSNRTLTGSVALTKLPQAAIVSQKGKSGQIRGVFLPIDGNNLVEKDGAVYMDVRIIIRPEKDQYDQDGFITKSLPSQVYKDNKDDKDFLNANQPILGNVREWASNPSNTPPVTEVTEDDELPF